MTLWEQGSNRGFHPSYFPHPALGILRLESALARSHCFKDLCRRLSTESTTRGEWEKAASLFVWSDWGSHFKSKEFEGTVAGICRDHGKVGGVDNFGECHGKSQMDSHFGQLIRYYQGYVARTGRDVQSGWEMKQALETEHERCCEQRRVMNLPTSELWVVEFGSEIAPSEFLCATGFRVKQTYSITFEPHGDSLGMRDRAHSDVAFGLGTRYPDACLQQTEDSDEDGEEGDSGPPADPAQPKGPRLLKVAKKAPASNLVCLHDRQTSCRTTLHRLGEAVPQASVDPVGDLGAHLTDPLSKTRTQARREAGLKALQKGKRICYVQAGSGGTGVRSRLGTIRADWLEL